MGQVLPASERLVSGMSSRDRLLCIRIETGVRMSCAQIKTFALSCKRLMSQWTFDDEGPANIEADQQYVLCLDRVNSQQRYGMDRRKKVGWQR